jgi:hypothetical protein
MTCTDTDRLGELDLEPVLQWNPQCRIGVPHNDKLVPSLSSPYAHSCSPVGEFAESSPENASNPSPKTLKTPPNPPPKNQYEKGLKLVTKTPNQPASSAALSPCTCSGYQVSHLCDNGGVSYLCDNRGVSHLCDNGASGGVTVV